MAFLEVTDRLLSVLGLTDSATSYCLEYQKHLDGAPGTMKSILQDLAALRKTTKYALAQLAGSAGTGYNAFRTWQGITEKYGPFVNGRVHLQVLADTLRSPLTNFDRFGRALKWPLPVREVERRRERLQQLEITTAASFEASATTAILEVQRSQRTLRERMLDSQRQVVLTPENCFQIMLTWLDAHGPGRQHTTLKWKRVLGSCQWLLQSEQYAAFKALCSAGLCLTGDTGTGKSMLCSAVIDDIEQEVRRLPTATLAYYYVDFSDEALASSGFILRSIVAQLASSYFAKTGTIPGPLYRRASQCFAHTRYGSKTAIWRDRVVYPSDQELVDVVFEIANSIGPTFIVLDGLLESSKDNHLPPELKRLLYSKKKKDGYHVLFTSEGASTSELPTDCSVVDLAEHVQMRSSDNQRLIEAAMTTCPSLRSSDATVQNRILAALSYEQRNTNYRLTELRIALIARCSAPEITLQTLANLPPTLQEAYAALLEPIAAKSSHHLSSCLLWLSVSSCPISADALTDMLAIGEISGEFRFDKHNCIVGLPDVLSRNTALVETRQIYRQDCQGCPRRVTEVRLAHVSLRNYLRDVGFDLIKHQLGLSTSDDLHAYIAERYLAYLLSFEERLTKAGLADLPFAGYASRPWLGRYRLRGVAPRPRLDAMVSKLFRCPETEILRNWIRLSDPEMPHKAADISRVGDFRTAFYYASTCGFENVVKTLLESTESDNMDYIALCPALNSAVRHGHPQTVAVLIDRGANVNMPLSPGHTTPLECAAHSGSTEMVELLLASGADVNNDSHTRGKESALCKAVRAGHKDIVQLLILAGADPNLWPQSSRESFNPLEVASRHGDIDLVLLMLPKASKWTATSAVGAVACNRRHDILELYMDKVPDAALHWSASLGFEDLTKRLLCAGAKSEHTAHADEIQARSTGRNGIQVSALIEACSNEHLAVARLLLAYGADANASSEAMCSAESALHAASDKGNVELVKLLLRNGAEVDRDSKRGTSLGLACDRGRLDVARVLINSGANIYGRSKRWSCCAEAAVHGNHLAVLELLVQSGLNLNLTSTAGLEPNPPVTWRQVKSALHAAVAYSRESIVDWLIKHGADVNESLFKRSSSDDDNLLAAAASRGNLRILELFLAAGARMTSGIGDRGRSLVLAKAVQGENVYVAKRLIQLGADVNGFAPDGHGKEASVLAHACMGKSATMVQCLLEASADPRANVRLQDAGEAPIHTAVDRANSDMLAVLAHHGADLNQRTAAGRTPLDCAATGPLLGGSLEKIKALLALGADANIPGIDGLLPLHRMLASSLHDHNAPACIDLLINAGNGLNARTSNGLTPLHYAVKTGKWRAVERLLDLGADLHWRTYGASKTTADLADAEHGSAYGEYDPERVRWLLTRRYLVHLEEHFAEAFPVVVRDDG